MMVGSKHEYYIFQQFYRKKTPRHKDEHVGTWKLRHLKRSNELGIESIYYTLYVEYIKCRKIYDYY